MEYRLGLLGEITGSDEGLTSLDGYAVIDCRPNERYYGNTFTYGTYVQTVPQHSYGWDGQFNSHCGTTRQLILTGDVTRVYTLLSNVARNANLQFGFGRSRLRADIVSGDSGYYSPSLDKVVLGSTAIVGEFGRFVIGHEYGHAYHHTAMGGLNPDYSVNCNPHYLNAPSSYGCALSEGFADFFGAHLTGALLGNFEMNAYQQSGLPDPKTEGAVAAAFLDIFDPVNSTVESHDAAQWEGAYLPRLVGTCHHLTNGVWHRASGIDHITYCLAQDIDAFVTALHSSERASPTSWTHWATLPSTWSKATARPLWHANVF